MAKKTPTTKTKTTKPAPAQQGLMADIAKAFKGLDDTLLATLAQGAPIGGGGFDDWRPPAGRYVLQVQPYPASKPVQIVPHDEEKEPFTKVELAITILGTDPGLEELVGREFTIPYLVIPRQDNDGNIVCYAFNDMKSLATVAFGDEYDLAEVDHTQLTAIVCQIDDAFDVTVNDRDNKKNPDKPFAQYIWHGTVEVDYDAESDTTDEAVDAA